MPGTVSARKSVLPSPGSSKKRRRPSAWSRRTESLRKSWMKFRLGVDPLLQDPTISDILVTTPRMVYVERGRQLYRTPVEFKDDSHLRASLRDRVASRPARRRILPDGGRASSRRITRQRRHPPGRCGRSPAFHSPFRPPGFERRRSGVETRLHRRHLELLKSCVKARLNILISGGTGSGKTTLHTLFRPTSRKTSAL